MNLKIMLLNKNSLLVCISKHLCTTYFDIINLIFIDNSQEESSNSSATGDFVFLNTSNGKLQIIFYYCEMYILGLFNFYCR